MEKAASVQASAFSTDGSSSSNANSLSASAEEFLSLEYFYASIRGLESEDTAVFSRLIEYINKDVIKLKELTALIQQKRGIPDFARSLVWRILLNYLPETRKQWTNIIENNARHYADLVNEQIVSRNKKQATTSSSSSSSSSTAKQSQSSSSSSSRTMEFQDSQGDHPLNRTKNSSWNEYFKDIEVWETIEKDTRRTRVDFFSKPNDNIYSGGGSGAARLLRRPTMATTTSDETAINSELRHDVLTRILFLYYKITDERSPVRYVQGMNEIAGVIYQCFASESCEYLRRSAESDAFYCFCIVMTKIKAMFSLAPTGQRGSKDVSKSSFSSQFKLSIDAFTDLLRRADAQLAAHFQQLNVDPKLYCFTWMMGFFCQTFDAQKTMQIWDALLVVADIIEFLPFICAAMLYINREELLAKTQYSNVIIKMQTFGVTTNVDKLIKTAFALHSEFAQKISR